jgi:hypothetical protein
MSYYRVKIEEKNNGKKSYIPQVAKLSVMSKWCPKAFIKWENIITNSYATKYMSTIYYTEQEALNVIENYKKHLNDEYKNSVKSTSYKIIN